MKEEPRAATDGNRNEAAPKAHPPAIAIRAHPRPSVAESFPGEEASVRGIGRVGTFLFESVRQLARMKLSPRLPLMLATLFTLAAGSAAQDPVKQLLGEAQAAYQRGDLTAAKAKFESVNQLDPRNQTALMYLRQIRAREAAGGGNTSQSLSTIVLPSVQFRDAELSAVLEVIRQQVIKLTGGKQPLNFVVQLPPEQAKAPINLSLINVPLTEVLKYIGSLAGVTFTFEKYAIMVRPAAAPAEPGAAAPR